MAKTEGARRLHKLTRGKDWSQSAVARLLRVSTSTVSRWVSGKLSPTTDHRTAIGAAFGIPVDSWLTPHEIRRREVLARIDAVAEVS